MLDFGLIVHWNVLQVVVLVIIIDQWNQTAYLREIQVTVIYCRAKQKKKKKKKAKQPAISSPSKMKSNSPWIPGQKYCQKGLRCSMFVWNYVKRLTFRARTADVTLCWRNSFAARDVRRHFLCVDFFSSTVLICLPHYLGTKPNIMPLNTLNQTKLTRNSLEKSYYRSLQVSKRR